MNDAFRGFIEAAGAVVDRYTTNSRIVREIHPLLGRLVTGRGWLEPRFTRPIPEKAYAQYLLHLDPDDRFSIVSFVWNPGQGSPIHDHLTWGVIGQYEGIEEETRFGAGNGPLQQLSRVMIHPGDVSHVHPPDRDVHEIRNPGTTPSVSIHIYGTNIGTWPRHVFDADGLARPFVSGYDTPQD